MPDRTMPDRTRPPHREDPARYAAASATPLGLWRYRDLLPPVDPVTLGEGWTPLLRVRRHPGLYLKDEARNPTGSVTARGLALAAAIARHENIHHVAVASPAEAAYAAAAGIQAHAATHEGTLFGADRTPGSWPQLTAAIEGEMTLGYELCEHFNWQPPEAIFCPATLIPALAQSFARLETLGWTTSSTPHLHPAEPLTRAATTSALQAFAQNEGLLLSSEGAAAYAAYLAANLPPTTLTVLINPTQGRTPIQLPTSMPVGGIITPV